MLLHVGADPHSLAVVVALTVLPHQSFSVRGAREGDEGRGQVPERMGDLEWPRSGVSGSRKDVVR